MKNNKNSLKNDKIDNNNIKNNLKNIKIYINNNNNWYVKMEMTDSEN